MVLYCIVLYCIVLFCSSRKCGLEPFEYDIYCKLRQTLSHKWELIIITAENQIRMQKQRKKIDKVISDSQERAFWRIHRPPVSNNIIGAYVRYNTQHPPPAKPVLHLFEEFCIHLSRALYMSSVSNPARC